MQSNFIRNFSILIILAAFSPKIYPEESRTLPIDLYLIIDGSDSFRSSKDDAVTWVNSRIVDHILLEGDNVTVWNAGDSASIIYQGTIDSSDKKNDLKARLEALVTNGKSADFSTALRELEAKVSGTPKDRLAYSMLITASAGGIEPVLTGNASGLLRWFRSERYERWQVLILGPDIGRNVRAAASEYMNSFR
jgi:hypothetical protein